MMVRYVTQTFENTDYNPVMDGVWKDVVDLETGAITQQLVQVPQPLDAEAIALAKDNEKYKQAKLAATLLGALGLSTTLELNKLVIRIGVGGSLIEVEE